VRAGDVASVAVVLIRCLGAVCVDHASPGTTSLTHSPGRILSLLAAAGPVGMTSEACAEELYFDREIPDKWNGSFRKAVQRLRRSVDVRHGNGRYRIDDQDQRVDLWQLRCADQLNLEVIDERELHLLLKGDPFSGIELSPLLSDVIEEVASCRVHVVRRMVAASRSDWSPTTLQVLRTLTARRHYQESLLEPVVRLHVDGGYRAEVLPFVRMARDYSDRELGVPLAPTITGLVSSGSFDAPAVAEPASIDGRVVGMTVLGTSGFSVLRGDLMDSAASAIEGKGVQLHGESGAGKTALLQQLVNRLVSSGNHVLWLNGVRGGSAAFGPFLAVVPQLEADLAPLLEAGHDELIRARCWSAARRRLAVEFAGLPLALVVDDAQWLDSHSRQLLHFLASSEADPPLRLLVGGRPADAAAGWKLLADGLERVGIASLKIGEFSEDDLMELIGVHHRHATSKQRRDFARALVDRKAALPLIAHELIQSAVPETLALAEHQSTLSHAQLWVDRVDDATSRVGAVAAVLGIRFRVADVAELTELSVDQVVQALDELQEAELLVGEQRPDEFSFRHVLIHRDFEAALSASDRRQLHMAAVALAVGPSAVHKRAHHVLEAGALMKNHEVVDAVLASARAFEAGGSYREAVAAFAKARAISDDEIPVQDLLKYITAMAGGGGDSWEVRSAAFEVAHRDGDAALCLEVALAGVRRSEDSMGDQRLTTMLERVVVGNLCEGDRVVHASALARELGLLGFNERALKTSRAAVRSATTATGRLTAWLGGWAAYRAVPPGQWSSPPADHHEVTDPILRMRLALVESAQALVRGDDPVARSAHQRAQAYQPVCADPLLRWHASLPTALFAFVDGDWERHIAAADQALIEASSHGVNAAFSARAAQSFVQFWVEGRHVELLPLLEAAPPDLQDSILARAALAATLAESADRQTDAVQLIEQIAEQAARRRSPFSHPAAALLASVPSAFLSVTVQAQLARVLEPFDGTAMTVGAGISHLGPVSWSLANLASDLHRRVRLLRRSVDEADRWALKLWSVRCRVDLAAATGDAALREEATRLAAGTALVSLLSR